MNKIAVLIWESRDVLSKMDLQLQSIWQKGLPGKIGKSCLFFRAQASWCKIVSKQASCSIKDWYFRLVGWFGCNH